MYGLFFHLFFYFIVYYGGCSCCYSHHNNNNLRQRIILNCYKPDAGREHFFQPLQRNVIGNFETLFYLYNDSRSIKFCLILRKSVFQLKFQEQCFDMISQSGPLVSHLTSTVSYRTVATSAVSHQTIIASAVSHRTIVTSAVLHILSTMSIRRIFGAPKTMERSQNLFSIYQVLLLYIL